MREYMSDPERRSRINAERRVKRLANPEPYREQDKRKREVHSEKIRERKRQYRQANKDKIREYNQRYNARKPEVLSNAREKWLAANPERAAENKARRKAIEKHAMPKWADRNAIENIYKQRIELEKVTEMQWHVDHIIPLQGKTICGLHIAENLQVLPATVNMQKSNKLLLEACS